MYSKKVKKDLGCDSYVVRIEGLNIEMIRIFNPKTESDKRVTRKIKA